MLLETLYSQLFFALNNTDAPNTVYITTDPGINQLALVVTTNVAVSFLPGTLVPPGAAGAGTGSLLYLSLAGLQIPAADFAKIVCTAPGWATQVFPDSIIGLTPLAEVALQPGSGHAITLHIEHLVVPVGPASPSANLSVSYYRVPPCAVGALPQTQFFKVLLQTPPSGHRNLADAIACVLNGGTSVCNSLPQYQPVSNQLSVVLQPGILPTTVLAGPDTRFFLSFVYAATGPGYGALTTPQQASGINVRQGQNASAWSITPNPSAENPFWTLTPPNNEPLVGVGVASVVEFNLDSLVTDFAPGPTLLYLQYQKVPGYNDGGFYLLLNKVAHADVRSLTATPNPVMLDIAGNASVRLTWTVLDAGTMLLSPGLLDVTGRTYHDATITGPETFVLLADGRYMADRGNIARAEVKVGALPFGNKGLFIRNQVGATPIQPGTGWPNSPDIICSGPMPLPDPSAVGNLANYSAGLPASQLQAPLQNNYVYIRALNPFDAQDTSTVFLYCVETALVLYPQAWQLQSVQYLGANNAVRLTAAAKGLVGTNPPFVWQPPRAGVAYSLLTWVQTGPDQATPPDLSAIAPGQTVDQFLAAHPNLSWRNMAEDKTMPTPTWARSVVIESMPSNTIFVIGLQIQNMPTDGFVALSAPGPDAINTAISPKSRIVNPTYTPAWQLEWPAGFASVMCYSYYQGATKPPAGASITPFIALYPHSAGGQPTSSPGQRLVLPPEFSLTF